MNFILFCIAFLSISSYCKVYREHMFTNNVTYTNSIQYNYHNGLSATAKLRHTGNGYKACDPTVKQFSGYIDIQSVYEKNYFYWAFESKKSPETAPVVLWMTGGPGCSSEFAAVQENGPCRINPNLTVSPNPYSWNNVATIIYIDQPAGVGFSYSNGKNRDYDEKMVSQDMYVFVQLFFEKFPQYADRDFFIVGESYGGHFVPATSHRIWQGNENKEGKHINIRGFSTGNGLVNPTIQFQYYAQLAYNWCINVTGKPCVTKSVYEKMNSLIPSCVEALLKCNTYRNEFYCNKAFNDNACTYQMNAFQETGLNVYNVKLPCIGSSCYNFTYITQFFNLRKVQLSLGAITSNSQAIINYQQCSDSVYSDFTRDFMQDYSEDIPSMLESGIRAMIYAGDLDFICNWLGNRAWTHALQWSKHQEFVNSTFNNWKVDGKVAGQFQYVPGMGNSMHFSFVKVNGAGHMVPMDQPKHALYMFSQFISNKSL